MVKAKRQIEALLIEHQLPATEVQLEMGTENELLVAGIVADNKVRHRLVEELKSVAYPTVTQLTTAEELLEACRQVMDHYQMHLNFEYLGEGTVAMRGFVRDKDLVNKISLAIRDDLPKIQRLVDDQNGIVHHNLRRARQHRGDAAFYRGQACWRLIV